MNGKSSIEETARPSASRILTFRQYVNKDRARIAHSYKEPFAKVERLYPDSFYTASYWAYVLDAFEAGQDFTAQGLATLTAAQLRDLSRTTRALRNGIPYAVALAGNRLAIA